MLKRSPYISIQLIRFLTMMDRMLFYVIQLEKRLTKMEIFS